MTIADWDDLFENSAYIAQADRYPAHWAERAETYRRNAPDCELDIAYGDHDRQKYDLFRPDGTAVGVMVFVHGGYWMKLDKSSWSHLAQGALARGWAVAIPSYVLTPAARISEITRQIGTMICDVQRRFSGPMRLAGHSAGGHLVSRMICQGGPLATGAAARIEHVLSISGLHDLRPLLRTAMNRTLGLDEAEAARESAALARPLAGAWLTTWVGADERPEFIRQSQLMADAWPTTRCIQQAGQHHFSVIDGLADPDSAIIKTLLG